MALPLHQAPVAMSADPQRPQRVDPYALSAEQLAAVLSDEPSFRVRQVRHWLARGVADPAAMTDLPKRLRERLAAIFPTAPRTLSHVTADGGLTHKVLLELADGEAIESVLLCYPRGVSGSEPAGGDRRVRASGSEPAGGDRRVRASGSEPAGGDRRRARAPV
jgi:23S rRNA (adenine2503-C2)-methyltransferase